MQEVLFGIFEFKPETESSDLCVSQSILTIKF